jgi:hypothetical protein
MTRTVRVALQTIWGCRWSRPTYAVIGTPLHEEALWVCVRKPHDRRVITEEECESCEHWRPDTGITYCHSHRRPCG